jgi:propionyl-CoA carboxylase alpha chain
LAINTETSSTFSNANAPYKGGIKKVVEEAPSSVLTPALRQAMGEAATNVARAANYYGAGTVEFILDEKLNFYFLEMNTRLQVEHPVTEMITGLDLVKLQLRIAEGEPLPFRQGDVKMNGHAIEARVYAEDPTNNFLPDIGRLNTYKRPQGNGVRVDDGFEQGMNIPFYYDPMIAKLVCHAESRAGAMEKMIRAIDEYEITGLETTLGFCKYVMQHPSFRSGDFDTQFVEKFFSPQALQSAMIPEEALIAAALSTSLSKPLTESNHRTMAAPHSKWKKNRIDFQS